MSFSLKRALYLVGALIFSVLPAVATVEGPAAVIDGDTLEISGQSVRLEGIDAPEISQTCLKADGEIWPCGNAAAEVLRALIAGRSIACDSKGTDKYGRTLGICFADAEEINAAMVRHGYAWAFVRYSQDYISVEGEARRLQSGVWQGQAEPPWEFRQKRFRQTTESPASSCSIKGNVSKKGQIFHVPGSAWYSKVKVDAARGERWFCSEAEALEAGWRPAIGPQ